MNANADDIQKPPFQDAEETSHPDRWTAQVVGPNKKT
jgi:hypothetical protein